MKILHIVHCIDTEGPLNETLKSTFDRIYNTYKVKLKPTSSNLEKLQKQKIKLGGIEKNISNFVSKSNLNYINNLSMLKKMLNHILSKKISLYNTR